MGYQIQYGTTLVKTVITERKKHKLSRKTANIILACFVILLAVLLGSRTEVQDVLIPGNSKVTRAAVSKIVTNLREGEPFSESFEAFCREIVNAANIPE